jgi:hypothetical protein
MSGVAAAVAAAVADAPVAKPVADAPLAKTDFVRHLAQASKSVALAKITPKAAVAAKPAHAAKPAKIAKPAADDAQLLTSTAPAATPLAVVPQMLAAVLGSTDAGVAQPKATTEALALVGTARAARPTAPPIAAQQVDDPPPVAPAADSSSEPPMTPLEQAVHDLLAQLDHHDDEQQPSHDDAPEPAPMPATTTHVAEPVVVAGKPVIAPAAPVAAPVAQELQSAHHARIVLDDGDNRVVMTVAIRGSSVNVSFKANDDHTAAALARNAGSLDEAMRRRGLDLDQFQTERELPRQKNQQQPPEPQPADPETSEPFELEETP